MVQRSGKLLAVFVLAPLLVICFHAGSARAGYFTSACSNLDTCNYYQNMGDYYGMYALYLAAAGASADTCAYYSYCNYYCKAYAYSYAYSACQDALSAQNANGKNANGQGNHADYGRYYAQQAYLYADYAQQSSYQAYYDLNYAPQAMIYAYYADYYNGLAAHHCGIASNGGTD